MSAEGGLDFNVGVVLGVAVVEHLLAGGVYISVSGQVLQPGKECVGPGEPGVGGFGDGVHGLSLRC